jgi:hypothetical protein
LRGTHDDGLLSAFSTVATHPADVAGVIDPITTGINEILGSHANLHGFDASKKDKAGVVIASDITN